MANALVSRSPFVFCLGPYEGGAQCTHSNAAVLQHHITRGATGDEHKMEQTDALQYSPGAAFCPRTKGTARPPWCHQLRSALPHSHRNSPTGTEPRAALVSCSDLAPPRPAAWCSAQRRHTAPRWHEWRIVFENTDETNFSLILLAIVLL